MHEDSWGLDGWKLTDLAEYIHDDTIPFEFGVSFASRPAATVPQMPSQTSRNALTFEDFGKQPLHSDVTLEVLVAPAASASSSSSAPVCAGSTPSAAVDLEAPSSSSTSSASSISAPASHKSILCIRSEVFQLCSLIHARATAECGSNR